MKSMPFPKQDHVVRTCTANVYHFRWSDYSSWAIFTICDGTGELSIQSDWGNFSYRWHTNALGAPSLHHFLVTCDGDYVVRKLASNSQDLKDVYDETATLREFRTKIVERRCRGKYHKTQARRWWNIVERFCKAMEPGGLTANVSLDWPEVFEEFDDAWECVRYSKPPLWYVLQDELLPRLFAYLKEHVLPNHPATAMRET